MPFTVYILYSPIKDRYYVGQPENVIKRLTEHNTRKNLGSSDWVLKYTESFHTCSEAVKRESEIKSKKRRSYIEELIKSVMGGERPASYAGR